MRMGQEYMCNMATLLWEKKVLSGGSNKYYIDSNISIFVCIYIYTHDICVYIYLYLYIWSMCNCMYTFHVNAMGISWVYVIYTTGVSMLPSMVNNRCNI